jgi:pyruvate/2-oxoglutarate dehydrogenase complex dihydrolipoamide dehydrogenase (E3) component
MNDFDIGVIGAGSGGLSVAAGASQLGLNVALFEAHEMGGDCLNFGCVPSKALIAAAEAAQAVRKADRFGIVVPGGFTVDYAKVKAHVKSAIAAIAPNDSQARFEGLGVTVIRAHAAFVGPRTVEANGTRYSARKWVIATGSRASRLPIPGLADIPYFTNETIFDLDVAPSHLVVIGGGAIGCEIAHAYARLGTSVTLLEAGPSILAKEDPEAVGYVRDALIRDGVHLRENIGVVGAEAPGTLVLADGNRLQASHILVAAGRVPNIDRLGLDAAGITHTPKGIAVDARLRTSNRDVLAIGDCAGGPQFTHVAGWQAGIAIKNLCFRIPAKADFRAIPRATYTDPELAQVGMTEAEAKAAGIDFRLARWSLHENDRATAQGGAHGMAKIVADKKGRVIGATIVGPHAGELIHAWTIAVEKRLTLASMAGTVVAYPTLAEIGKRAAGASFAPKLFSPRTRKLVRFLFRLPI